MPPNSARFYPRDYAVGWICASTIDFSAARAVLDEEHESDQIHYARGSIGGLNVAIIRSATDRNHRNPKDEVASLISMHYTGLRFLLTVGVGSGVPSSTADIRLGDVVIGEETVWYDCDYGNILKDERPASLRWLYGKPLKIVNQAISEIRLEEQNVSGLSQFVTIPTENLETDILFEAEYNHEGEETCDWCNAERQKIRRPRAIVGPRLFYGRTAFGKQVVRDGRIRDRLSADLGGILCLETEISGMLTSFSSLVLRGICDYADSHANEKWRPYAAVNAAAYARLILLEIQPRRLSVYTTMEELSNQYLKTGKIRQPAYATNRSAKSRLPSTQFSRGQHLVIDDPKSLPFRIIKPLGRGGCAVVNMVEDRSTARNFAHKSFGIYYNKGVFQRAEQSFHNEIEIMKRLSFNPHIIEVFASYTVGRELGMLLTPIASDGSLADYLAGIIDSGTGPNVEQRSILNRSFGCLASGLVYIHKNTIRHKDTNLKMS